MNVAPFVLLPTTLSQNCDSRSLVFHVGHTIIDAVAGRIVFCLSISNREEYLPGKRRHVHKNSKFCCCSNYISDFADRGLSWDDPRYGERERKA